MDDDTPSRRSRLGASTLSAAALLVLTFGPSALALSPSTAASAAPPARVVVSAPIAAAVATPTVRSQDEEDADGTAAASGTASEEV